MHYQRWLRRGDPSIRLTIKGLDPLERFMTHVQPGSNGCWNWTAATRNGYGVFAIAGRKQIGSHRWIYQRVVGPIPDGLQIDHLCRNPRCCNPTHLQAVTIAENVLRGIGITAMNARKTHCPKGHPYDKVRKNGSRRCSICAWGKAA